LRKFHKLHSECGKAINLSTRSSICLLKSFRLFDVKCDGL